MSENRMMRIFGHKRDDIRKGWRKLRNKVLRNLHSSSKIRMIESRRVSCTEHVACIEENGSGCKMLVQEADGKRQLGRSKPRWENITILTLKK
jgi:predicted HTH transcriptional regulator